MEFSETEVELFPASCRPLSAGCETELPAPPELIEYEPVEAFDRTQVRSATPKTRKLALRAGRRKANLRNALQEFVTYLREERRVAEQSARIYAADVKQYVTWLEMRGVETPEAISPALVQRFVHDLRAGQLRDARAPKMYSPLTINRKIAAIRAWHGWLWRRYRVPDPMPRIEVDTPATSAPRVLSPSQILALRQAPDDSPSGLRDRALLAMLCACGLRAAELCALRESDVDLAGRSIIYRGENERLVSLDESACAALEDYLQRGRPSLITRRRKAKLRDKRSVSQHDLLFLNERGRVLSAATLGQIVRRHAQFADLPDWVSPGALRRSWAAILLQNGGDWREVQAMLGEARTRATPLISDAAGLQRRREFQKAHPRA